MKKNPFSLDFGAEPQLYISRNEEHRKVIETFVEDIPSTHLFLLIGVRGSGKTVLMTAVSHALCEEKKWLHIDLNQESDILYSLASGIYNKTKGKFPKIKLGVKIRGVEVSIEKDERYMDVQTDLDTMLGALDKHGIRLLITLDEVNNSKNVRKFTNYYQHSIRERFPLFVIMAGIHKNIRALQNNCAQTFLRRVPRINLEPLNLRRVANKYSEVFDLNKDEAYEMAKQTGGYSYGFQMLGYLVYESGNKKPDDNILEEYRLTLEENSYDKIWEELSENERKVAIAIARSEDNSSVKEVREILGLDSNNFSTYQGVLQKSGILASDSAYGRVSFALPYFREFALQQGKALGYLIK